MEWFSVNTVFFTILEYPMSYVEFAGTILYLLSVYLIVIKNIWTWPVGIASVILFFLIFYQIRLYSDALEQIYYLAVSIYGWWRWVTPLDKEKNIHVPVRYSPLKTLSFCAAGTIVVSLVLGTYVKKLHILFPVVFPEPAAFPYIDALTTIMSFTAMFLLSIKRVESWIYWIIVDIIGIWLYFVKEVRFISLLYVILLIMAAGGFIRWHRERIKQEKEVMAVSS